MKRRLGTMFAVLFGLVVLLGTLGAASRFVGRKARPKAYECKVTLRDILWAQRAYRNANGRYAMTLEELRVKLPERRQYTYSLHGVGSDDFTARCESVAGEVDVWTLSGATGEPVHLK